MCWSRGRVGFPAPTSRHQPPRQNVTRHVLGAAATNHQSRTRTGSAGERNVSRNSVQRYPSVTTTSSPGGPRRGHDCFSNFACDTCVFQTFSLFWGVRSSNWVLAVSFTIILANARVGHQRVAFAPLHLHYPIFEDGSRNARCTTRKPSSAYYCCYFVGFGKSIVNNRWRQQSRLQDAQRMTMYILDFSQFALSNLQRPTADRSADGRTGKVVRARVKNRPPAGTVVRARVKNRPSAGTVVRARVRFWAESEARLAIPKCRPKPFGLRPTDISSCRPSAGERPKLTTIG